MMNLPPITISTADRDRLAAIAVKALGSPRAPPVAAILLGELARANVVAESALPRSVVRMHSRVEVRDDIGGGLACLALVFPGEEDEGAGRISVLAPLGAALIGLAEGDTISWCTATGEPRRITVLRVLAHADEVDGAQPVRRKEHRGRLRRWRRTLPEKARL